MNYKQIVMKAIVEKQENYTSYFSYFERQAKIAEQEMYKPTDFFDGCVNVIRLYKEKIISAYEKRYTENDRALIDYKKAKEQGHTIDEKGVTIQSHIDYIEKNKLFVKNLGYKTNTNIVCELDKDGNISQSVFDTKITLSWYEVEEIEQGLLKAKEEILPRPNIRYSGIAKQLEPWVSDADDTLIEEIIIHKKLILGREKLTWIGDKNDAIIFCDLTGVKVSEWNKCFTFSDQKKLLHAHRSDAQYKEYEIEGILRKFL